MSATINVRNIPSGYQTIITNGTHSILGDEPIEIKGTGLGLAPTELLLSAIAMCKVTTIRFEAKKRGWILGDIIAELTQETGRGENRRLSTKLITKIYIHGNINESQKEELLQKAENCYIVRTITGDWDMEISGEINANE